MITNEETWRAELKQRGVEIVKLKLLVAGVGQQTMVDGFNKPPSIPRSFVEDWVAEEERRAAEEERRAAEEERRAAEEERKAAEIMRRTLHWAIVAGRPGARSNTVRSCHRISALERRHVKRSGEEFD